MGVNIIGRSGNMAGTHKRHGAQTPRHVTQLKHTARKLGETRSSPDIEKGEHVFIKMFLSTLTYKITNSFGRCTPIC